MKKKIVSLCVAALMAAAQTFGAVTLNVPEVSIVPGATANVVLYFDLGATAYTAYQLDIAFPEGISPVNDAEGNPSFAGGDLYAGSHNISSTYTARGLARFQCFSVGSAAFTAQSGTLLTLPITAQKTLAEGTYQATISPIEFVQTDATPDRPEAITFNIKVSRAVVLDETATTAPTAATGVQVQVKRTFKANEWSTICLPFAMTEAQLQTAFGSDVQLGDFTGYEAKEDQAGKTVSIIVNFQNVTAMEANHPYIIKVGKDVTEFQADPVDIAPDAEPTLAVIPRRRTQWSEFIGTYVAGTPVPEWALFLYDGKFYYSTGATKMKAFRGYFDFSDVLTDAESSNGVKLFIDGVETAVSLLNFGPRSTGKWFDLGGRQIEATRQEGLYIINGQKKVLR